MKTKNKKSFSLQSLLLFVLFVTSFSMAQEMTLEELETAAKAEGKVVVYSFTSRIFTVEEAFEAKYPEIDLEAFDIANRTYHVRDGSRCQKC